MKKIIIMIIFGVLFSSPSLSYYDENDCDNTQSFIYINNNSKGGKIIINYIDCDGESRHKEVRNSSASICASPHYEIHIEACPKDDWEFIGWGIISGGGPLVLSLQ